MTALGRYVLTGLWGMAVSLALSAQRAYKPHSVLASGAWYKVGVPAEGIYKMDAAFLSSLGLPGSFPSAQLRLYSKNTAMLPEAAGALYSDDLEEVALQVVDGGDGTVSGADYVLFYSRGPHPWKVDTASRRLTHTKNLYSEQLYYYLTLGGAGNAKRVQAQTGSPSPVVTVTSFDERYFHELDSVNFLLSGKEWFGEEFSSMPGRSLARSFTVPAVGAQAGAPLTLLTSVAARSVNAGSQFAVLVNNTLVQALTLPAVSSQNLSLYAQTAQGESSTPLLGGGIAVTFQYTPGSFNAQGWLNWFELFYRRALALPATGALLFRDWNSVGNAAVQYIITGADAGTLVWDVTDPSSPVRMNTTFNGGQLSFAGEAATLREYAAFGSSALTPQAAGKVANQDLHNTVPADYIIITHPAFLAQAQRLASFHEERSGLKTVVVTTEQVFNEFSAGVPDPTALRDFVKMYYDRYRSTWTASGKYLLLMGKGSFDYKDRLKNNTAFVPVWESPSSLDPLATYTSDDFFGFLDDNEDINSGMLVNVLDIGIGRVPVRSAEEAGQFVDKVEAYHAPESLGPWRNNLNFVADDEDFNLHLQDAEVLTATTSTTAPVFNNYKLYLDAFRQEGGSAGGRYPQANEAINNNIYNGTLIWNYSGHGGPQRLAEEVVIDQGIVNRWNNAGRLPLFITATCDFAPYDNPVGTSLGENLLVRPLTGAIALMTTSRVVFAFSNRIMNNNYLRLALERDSAGRYKTLGEAVQAAKNFTYQNSGDIINNRKFSLLGDPAMTLGYPKLNVVATAINGTPVAAADTLSATEYVTIEGEVRDRAGARLPGFNGTVYLTLFDKPQTITTLANDPSSLPTQVQTQTASLFRGKVSATGGQFSFRFRLPRDINFQYGKGKLSLYAQDGTVDGNGLETNVVIGGIAPGADTDSEGPQIRAYLNDERFVNGSITNESPVLILKLSDSSGINTGNAGIDHDIVATLDGDNQTYYVLNDFYETALDSYQEGTVRFQLPTLAPGPHTLKIKAWDVLNNSNEYLLEFNVTAGGELVLDHVLNYPNPFTDRTTFWFEHNRQGVDLQAKVEIMTVSGKIIKTLTQTINTPGNRSSDIEWDGRDEYGDRIGRGVYLYRLTVQSPDGKKARRLQRLVLIR
jgi:hypothetical protein